MYASATSLRRGVAEGFKPDERISVIDGITKTLKTKNGDYNPDLAPYMAAPANALGKRSVRVVVFIGPARCSKTMTLIDGWAARNIVYAPGDMLIVQSSQDLARYYSKHSFSPTIQFSPELKKRLSRSGTDDTTYDKTFSNGMVLAFGWPSGQQLSGRTFRYVAVTEYDACADDVDGEGSLFVLAGKRNETFMSAGKMVVETSIRRTYREANWKAPVDFPHEAPPATGATALYNTGTRNWFYWRCPSCREWFALDPDIHVMFRLPRLDELAEELSSSVDPGAWAAERAVLGCPHCGDTIPESMKSKLNLEGVWVPDGCKVVGDGEIVGTPRDSDIDSYALSSIAAAYGSWRKILEKEVRAILEYKRTGDETEIKSTVNLDQGRAYLPIAAMRRAGGSHALQDRVELWPEGHVPQGVRFLLAQIDIQAGKKPRFVVQILGIGVNRERWIVDRFALKSSTRPTGEVKEGKAVLHAIDPSRYIEDWDRLIDKVVERRYPLADDSGRTMPVRFVTCDSGGKAGVTRRAYEFWRRLREKHLHNKFRLVKGAERESAKSVEETYPDSAGRKDRNSGAAGDVPVLIANVTTIKDTVMADIYRETPGPGYYHFPKWLHPSAFEEYDAESRGAKRWEQDGNKPNESIDLAVYGEVALIRLGADKIDWNTPPSWAETWDKNPDVRAGDDSPPPVPVRRTLRRATSKYLGG